MAADTSTDHQVSIFSSLVEGRSCGDCVACCSILSIDEPQLEKKADVLCGHNTGKGCSIYQTRPGVCRTWFCLWRRIPAMPEYARPDKIGVVFSLDRHLPPRTLFENLYIIGRAINGPNEFEGAVVKSVVQMFVENGVLPVWLSFEGNKSLVFPHGPFADAIQQPSTMSFQTLATKALAWRSRYDLILSTLA